MLWAQSVSRAPVRLSAKPSTEAPTEADRDFVVKVHVAGLWEYPVRKLALTKGVSKAVRTAEENLAHGDAVLDANCGRIARLLGIKLPNLPSPHKGSSRR